MQPTYLFILSPPYSGSTVLWRLLQTSSQVSALPDEGQKLPELRSMMRNKPWDVNTVFDWNVISRTWHGYWDCSKSILLEKSPPHLCRADIIARHFQPAKFILLLRDPLAISEALHRRNGMDWEPAAKRWCEWLAMHMKVRAQFTDSFLLYYEDMVADPASTFAALGAWLPALADVDHNSPIEAHAIDGVHRRPLSDMNRKKLKTIDPQAKQRILSALTPSLITIQKTPYAAKYF